MKVGILKHLQKNSFWLSLLLHLIFLLSILFSIRINHLNNKHDLPDLTIPAYTYQEEQPVLAAPLPVKKEDTPPQGLEKPKVQSEASKTQVASQAHKKSEMSEPISLVGDKKIKKPLLELLGKALAKTLVYPKIAKDFNLRGIAYVSFIIDPSGELEAIRLVQSSGTDLLDQAAVQGVMAISPVGKANQFLQAKKYMVVGIIFR